MMPLTAFNNETEWNRFVLENGGGFLQSWEWGIFQEAVGRLVYRYRIDITGKSSEKEPIGQFLIVGHSLPLGQKYLYLPKGPVVQGEGYRPESFRACVRAAQNAAKRLNAIFVRVEPPAVVDDQMNRTDMKELGLKPVGQVQPQHTTIVDLKQSENQLLANMKQKTRYNVRLAEKRGVQVRRADINDSNEFGHFWRLMQETTERDRFSAHSRSYYRTMLKVLGGNPGGNGLSLDLLFAEYQDEPVAAALVCSFGDTATYLHGASTAKHKKIMAPYLLHWTAMRKAKEKGLKAYDFWGVAPEDAGKEHPWHGITRFKMGFGGDRISYIGAWEMPVSRFRYAMYLLARRFRG